MSGLEISNATYGYKKDEIDSALNKINVNVIEKAIKDLDGEFDELSLAVSDFIKGKAAGDLIANMNHDKEIVKQGLLSCFNALKGEFYEIGDAIARTDANLIDRRGE